MELVRNLSFIEAAAEQLISAKPCWYNTHEIWTELSKYPKVKCQVLEINCTENSKEQFVVYHIANKDKNNLPCLIYLHGLSSYCFQGQYLFQYMTDNFNLCLYDLRGHGKNKNSKVTYGLKESADLYDLVMKMISKGVRQIYLWGRSMGASTILNFVSNYGGLLEIKEFVKFIVLDSPFCSFQQIGKETIGKNLGMPSFICSPLINAAIAKIVQKEKIDLRALDFSGLQPVKIPAAFIYSVNDDIVNCGHSEKIIRGYGGKIFELKGEFAHNEPRPKSITEQAISLFEQGKKHKVRQNSDITRSCGPKKGLSISLISCKNIKDDDKENRSPIKLEPNRQQKYSPLSRPSVPLVIPTLNQKQLNRVEYADHYLASYTIKRDLTNNRQKIQISKTLIEQPSKSKQKTKHKPLLTNRRYL